MMAYCLWPEYSDHVFAVMVGEGANGKSTIMRIIQEIVGRSNYSAVSLQQLASNKFMSAQLEGKLVNIAGEASGKELSYEQLNIIKALSAGDEITIERKNQQPYQAVNTAKLFFSANKVPQFAEKDRAITRRLLVLPFDMQIRNPDSNIEKRLIAEVPAILAMLVRHIQVKVAKEGKFIVQRGSRDIMAAQKKVLMEGNTVQSWLNENIVTTNNMADFEYSQNLYAHYTQWCESNGYNSVQHHKAFGMSLRAILDQDASTRRIGKRVGVGYFGIKLTSTE
jgi:P4 family phage/plasmid primase-like protien